MRRERERVEREGKLRVAEKGWVRSKHGKSRIMLMGTSDSVAIRYFKRIKLFCLPAMFSYRIQD